MTLLASIDAPELGSVVISLPNRTGVQFDHFLSYSYNENFLTPTDAWTFDVDQDELTDSQKKALVPGERVVVTIGNNPQSNGFIDDVITHTGRGGTIVTVEGRDWLAPSLDSQIDPQTSFTASQTVLNLLTKVFKPYGMKVIEEDNDANRNIITGATRGIKTTKKGKPIKSEVLQQLKPEPHEGAFAFAARACQRHGLWIWPGVKEDTIIVGKPNFDQQPTFALIHKTDDPSKNNIVDGQVKYSRMNQPSVILASGWGGGGEFPKSSLRCMAVNPYINADLTAIFNAYPHVPRILIPTPDLSFASRFADPNARPLYLYDSESHTQEQLEAYARRELSLRMRQLVSAHYTIEGHRLGGAPLAVDTIIKVDDDRSDVHFNMWVMGRTFSKQAGAGTRTQLELILPNTLVF